VACFPCRSGERLEYRASALRACPKRLRRMMEGRCTQGLGSETSLMSHFFISFVGNSMSVSKSAEKGLALLKKTSEKFFRIGLSTMDSQEARDAAIAEFLGEHATESSTQEGAIVISQRLNLDEYNEVLEFVAETNEISLEAARSIVKSSAQEKGLLNARSNRRSAGGLRRGKLATA